MIPKSIALTITPRVHPHTTVECVLFCFMMFKGVKSNSFISIQKDVFWARYWTASDGEFSVLDIWGVWSISPWQLLSGPLWPEVNLRSVDEIDLFGNYLYYTGIFCVIYQHLRMSRIWHKVSFLSSVLKFWVQSFTSRQTAISKLTRLVCPTIYK